MPSVRKYKAQRKGVTAVETAVVIGLCLMTLLAVLEYGRYMMVRALLENAARAGARMAAVSTNTTSSTSIVNAVNYQLAGQVLSPDIQLYWCDPATGASKGPWYDAPYGEGIAVRVSTSYSPMVPTFGILPNPMTISAVSVMRSEDN